MKKKLLFLLAYFLFSPSAYAQNPAPVPTGVTPLETTAKQALLLDVTTNAVLLARNADERMPTSSMSKIMTMYLVFDAIKNEKLKLEDTLPVSEHAWKQPGSRMFLNAGDRAKVEDLIRGVIVQSGNDSAVVLAEGLSGSEANFAELMNAKAKELGMPNSHFKNATGLPDPEHYSTARDLATLAAAVLRDFPDDYHYYSELEFTYNGIKQGNRNPLLYRNIGVDGLKTGHAEEAGYGLIASSVRDGRRLLLVINGLKDMQVRADESAKMLDFGYREYGLYPIVKRGEKMADATVWLGREANVPLVAANDVILTLPRSVRNGLRVGLNYEQPVQAPIAKGKILGMVSVFVPGLNMIEVPLVAGSDVDQLGFLARFVKKMKLLLGKA